MGRQEGIGIDRGIPKRLSIFLSMSWRALLDEYSCKNVPSSWFQDFHVGSGRCRIHRSEELECFLLTLLYKRRLTSLFAPDSLCLPALGANNTPETLENMKTTMVYGGTFLSPGVANHTLKLRVHEQKDSPGSFRHWVQTCIVFSRESVFCAMDSTNRDEERRGLRSRVSRT